MLPLNVSEFICPKIIPQHFHIHFRHDECMYKQLSNIKAVILVLQNVLFVVELYEPCTMVYNPIICT